MPRVSLVFTSSKTTFGRLIRWFTDSPVSHVMIEYTSVVWGGRWVAEAFVTGVRKRLAERRRRNVVVEYDFVYDISSTFVKVRPLFGEPYDIRGVFRLAFILLMLRLFRRRITRPMTSSKAQLCSEFIARILQHAGYPDTDEWDVETVTPETLRQYCEANPELFHRRCIISTEPNGCDDVDRPTVSIEPDRGSH